MSWLSWGILQYLLINSHFPRGGLQQHFIFLVFWSSTQTNVYLYTCAYAYSILISLHNICSMSNVLTITVDLINAGSNWLLFSILGCNISVIVLCILKTTVRDLLSHIQVYLNITNLISFSSSFSKVFWLQSLCGSLPSSKSLLPFHQ